MANNWKEVCLGEVCTIRRGSSPRPIVDYITDRGMPWVKIADATESDSKTINKTKQFLKEDGVCKSVIVEKGDLILSNSGTAGLPKFMGITACIHDGWQVFKDLNGITSEFLYYSLIHIRTRLLHGAYDSTMKNLTLDMVRDAKINLPPLFEQKYITNILCSIDDKIELNRQINQNLEQMAQALLKSWFVDFDPVIDNALAAGTNVSDFPKELKHLAEQREQAQKLTDFEPLPDDIRALFPSEFEQTDISYMGISGWIPKGWEVKELSQLVKHQKGFAFKSAWFQDEGHIVVRVSDTTDDSINVNSCNKISEKLAGEYSSYALKENDLVIATVGSWPPNYSSVVGKVIRVPRTAEGGLLNQNAVKLTVSDEYSFHQGFLHCSLKNRRFMEYIVNRAQGSANQASITLKSIFKFPILLANNEVMRAFSTQIKINFDKQNLNYQQIQNLTSLRDLLLPKLISGEITINKEVA